MIGTSRWASFAASLSEADVRRLSSPAAFRQGDAWERAGHVRNPVLVPDGIAGDVLGTWQRIDTARAFVTGNRLTTQCSCRSGEFCRHATALLLHLLRAGKSFPVAPDTDDAFGDDDLLDEDFLDDYFEDDLLLDAPVQENEIAPQEELSRLFELDTMPHLRVIARNRGLRVTAKNKADLIAQLADMLGTPESIDAALMGLTEDARLALEAVDLATEIANGGTSAVGMIYEALGGTGRMTRGKPAAMDTLVDLGLVMPADRYSDPPSSYRLPKLVRVGLMRQIQRAGRLSRLLRRQDVKGKAAPADLSLIEIFQVIAHEIQHGLKNVVPPISPAETANVPPGWRIDTGGQELPKQPRGQQSVRVLKPIPALIQPDEVARIAEMSGVSGDMIEFAVQLLMGLGIVHLVRAANQAHLEVYAENLVVLLGAPQDARAPELLDAYLSMGSGTDLRLVVGPNRPLQLHYRPSYYASYRDYQPSDTAARGLIARLVIYLAPGGGEPSEWYDFHSLLDLLWKLSPQILGRSVPNYGEWWFTDHEHPEQRLDLETRDGWQAVWEPLLAAMLSGPLSWLGLVEVAGGPKGIRGFRVTPRAGYLAVPDVAAAAPVAGPPLLFDAHPDTSSFDVTVPAGTPDEWSHTLMTVVGEMDGVSPRGLRYRVSAERIASVLGSGVSGEYVIELLAGRSGGAFPQPVRDLLERWTAAYGTIRLYDNVTLLELSDDVLLRELRATSSLDQAIVATLSPRLIVVDDLRVDELVAELERLGHTPRVVEAT